MTSRSEGSVLIERFLAKLQPRPTDGSCWEWQGYRSKYGYGIVTVARKSVRAHRLSWELFKGHLPNNLDVLHQCDNPCCVNPEHLFLGTDFDNQQDAARKGHVARQKLSVAMVHEIRKTLDLGLPQSEIASKFKIHQSQVSMINTGKRWGYLQ